MTAERCEPDCDAMCRLATHVNEIVTPSRLAAMISRYVTASIAIFCFCKFDRSCFYALAFCSVSNHNHHDP